MNDEITKIPERADDIPPDYDFEKAQADIEYDDNGESGGPGCLAWSIMGLFGLLIAIAIVLTAVLAGFNDGLNTARVTAAVATQQNIARQCTIIPTDIAAERFTVLESRFESMTINGLLPDCAAVFAPQATIIYEQSLITETLPATATATMTATSVPDVVQATATATSTAISSDSGYDRKSVV